MSSSILVVGSVAFDSVKTPFGEVDEILGGSATYFSVASSYFAPVRIVAVVGNDFAEKHIDAFRKHRCDMEGLKRGISILCLRKTSMCVSPKSFPRAGTTR